MPKISIDEIFSHRVLVKGSQSNIYTVLIVGNQPEWCTCPSFEHNKGPRGESCKHMDARRGRKAIGRTRCANCKSWLTIADITSAVEQQIPEPQRCCRECVPAHSSEESGGQ